MTSTKRKLQTGGGGSSGPGTPGTGGSDGDDEDYRKKRERNNLAVKRSRAKAKTRTTETEKRVNDLRMQNQRLEEKIKSSKKHVKTLKDLFKAQASQKREITEDDLRQILEDCNDNDDDELDDQDEDDDENLDVSSVVPEKYRRKNHDEDDRGDDGRNKSYNIRNVKRSSTIR